MMRLNATFSQFALTATVAILLAGASSRLSAQSNNDTAANDGFRCFETKEHVVISRGDAEVLRYNIVAPKAPEGISKDFERSGYIHPIYTPSGRLVTGDFAADHPHQHGLFVAWTNTSFQGKLVDFWNQAKKRGLVLHDRVISVDASKESAEFAVAVKHYAINKSGERTAILDDIWKVGVSVEKTGDDAGKSERYVIDFSTSQTNITEHPLTINEYHYGGIGFRGSNAWFSDDAVKPLGKFSKQPDAEPLPLKLTRHRFLTSDGNDRRLGNHSRPDWTALYGLVDDRRFATVKVQSSEENDRYPDPVRLHPSKPYFSISPCFIGAFDIHPGQTYRLKYRFEVFDGKP